MIYQTRLVGHLLITAKVYIIYRNNPPGTTIIERERDSTNYLTVMSHITGLSERRVVHDLYTLYMPMPNRTHVPCGGASNHWADDWPVWTSLAVLDRFESSLEGIITKPVAPTEVQNMSLQPKWDIQVCSFVKVGHYRSPRSESETGLPTAISLIHYSPFPPKSCTLVVLSV